jgi:hypothetical protein
MIDSSIAPLIGLSLDVLVLASVFLLPRERSKEELGLPVLYEERCSGRMGRFGFLAGGNVASFRISLYDTFLVIAFIGPTKVPYTEVESVDYRRQWVSNLGDHFKTGQRWSGENRPTERLGTTVI